VPIGQRLSRSCSISAYLRLVRAQTHGRCLQGHPKVAATFARVSGYVEQTDIHSPQVRLWISLTLFACNMFCALCLRKHLVSVALHDHARHLTQL